MDKKRLIELIDSDFPSIEPVVSVTGRLADGGREYTNSVGSNLVYTDKEMTERRRNSEMP